MKFSKLSKILTVVLLVSVLAISLIACSTSKDNKGKEQSTDSSISTLMATEPSNADEASKLYNQLMEKENEILSTDKSLWEKVFLASNKENPMIEDGRINIWKSSPEKEAEPPKKEKKKRLKSKSK